MAVEDTPIVAPRQLIIPVVQDDDDATHTTQTGTLKLSGAKLWFSNGTTYELVTSA